ncbi:MAG: MFS transporter [candidate division WS1 bacterium]|nr:MFS transporter [candidate division WS1 bacterium]
MSAAGTLTASALTDRQKRAMFWASSISLIATAMSFAIRGDILGDLEGVHELTKTQAGSVGNAWALGFALSILFGGALCDFIGMKRVMYLAVVGHSVGCAGIIFGPSPNFSILFASVLVMGIGNGMVEAAVNPLVATNLPEGETGEAECAPRLVPWWDRYRRRDQLPDDTDHGRHVFRGVQPVADQDGRHLHPHHRLRRHVRDDEAAGNGAHRLWSVKPGDVVGVGASGFHPALLLHGADSGH